MLGSFYLSPILYEIDIVGLIFCNVTSIFLNIIINIKTQTTVVVELFKPKICLISIETHWEIVGPPLIITFRG